MDIKKMNIPTFDGPNWGQIFIHLQAAAHILDCWDVLRGEVLGTTSQTYSLLEKPVSPGAQASAADLAIYNMFQFLWTLLLSSHTLIHHSHTCSTMTHSQQS